MEKIILIYSSDVQTQCMDNKSWRYLSVILWKSETVIMPLLQNMLNRVGTASNTSIEELKRGLAATTSSLLIKKPSSSFSSTRWLRITGCFVLTYKRKTQPCTGLHKMTWRWHWFLCYGAVGYRDGAIRAVLGCNFVFSPTRFARYLPGVLPHSHILCFQMSLVTFQPVM